MNSARLHRLLNVLDLKSFTLLDIGARDGIDQRWHLFGDRLFVVAVELDREECVRLNSTGQRPMVVLPVALWHKSGNNGLHVCRTLGSSSFYLPEDRFLHRFPSPERFDVIDSREVAVERLDDILKRACPHNVDFIKLDVQGAEKGVIEGGCKTIEGAFGLEVEVEFSELYRGQPLFSDVDVLIRESGYSLFDLRPCYWKRTGPQCKGIGQLVFGDALYFKDPIASDSVPANPGASIALCVVYRKFDYALELAAFYHARTVYSMSEHDRIRSLLLKLSSPTIPWRKIKGSERLARLLDALAAKLREDQSFRYDGWKM
jgi:FkbM family methyltransferase